VDDEPKVNGQEGGTRTQTCVAKMMKVLSTCQNY